MKTRSSDDRAGSRPSLLYCMVTVHGLVDCRLPMDRGKGFMSKVWLITGASRGFGRAFTEAVLEAGDRVVATARNPEQLVELEDRYSEKVCTVPLDVTNEAQAKAAFEAAIASFGGLDVLVNNAGYGYVCPVEDTPLADFRAQIETNLFGV